MGQHLDKAARGAYDAIVYIDGSEVVAEDSNGRKIASGVAGIDNITVAHAARDFIGINEKLVFSGSFTFNSSFIISSADIFKWFDFTGAMVFDGTDCILLDINSNGTHVIGFRPYINGSSRTSPVIRLQGSSNHLQNCNCNVYNLPTGIPIIQLRSGSWFNVIDDVTIIGGLYAPTIIQLSQQSSAGIQGNIFSHITGYAGGVTVEFIPYGNTYTSFNSFRDIALEASSSGSTKTTHVVKDIDGTGNQFHSVIVFDLASDAITFNTLSTSIGTSFYGGVWKKPGYYADLGLDTIILQDHYDSGFYDNVHYSINSPQLKNLITGNCETSEDLSAWTIARGTKELSSTNTFIGRKSIKVTGNDVSPALFQDCSSYLSYLGKYVTFGAWLYIPSSNAQECRMYLEATTSTCNNTIVERDQWVYKTCTLLVPLAAARLRSMICLGEISNTDIVYVSAASLCEGRSTVSNFSMCDLMNTIYRRGASGSSTGTGSEQTIAHGLAAIPTGCKAWIRYPISATIYAEKEIRMDATNIYPKVKTGLAYDWRVE